MALIYLATHGEKEEGPNPGLTENGRQQIQQLKKFLLFEKTQIVCGTGKRHLETAEALGLKPTRFSNIVGVPESKDRSTGNIILANGFQILAELYTSVKDRKYAFIRLVTNLPHNSVVITSRPFPQILGFTGGSKEGTVYRYDTETGKIEEIFATSENIGDGPEEV